MEVQTLRKVEDALVGRSFWLGVDLGCGYGHAAQVLKEHCNTLIGVDREPMRAVLSGHNYFYNELIEEDIRFYELPNDCDAVFLFDAIEHLPRRDAFVLLRRIGDRFCVVTTPTKFFGPALNGHLREDLWSVEDLERLGFSTKLYNCGLIRNWLYGEKIIAVRE